MYLSLDKSFDILNELIFFNIKVDEVVSICESDLHIQIYLKIV